MSGGIKDVGMNLIFRIIDIYQKNKKFKGVI